jgi:hypothetical protein
VYRLSVSAAAAIAGAALLMGGEPAAVAGPQTFSPPTTGPIATSGQSALVGVDGRLLGLDARGRVRRVALPAGSGIARPSAYEAVPGGFAIASARNTGVYSATLRADGTLAAPFTQPEAGWTLGVSGRSAADRTVAWGTNDTAKLSVQHIRNGAADPVQTLPALSGYGYSILQPPLMRDAGAVTWIAVPVDRSAPPGECCSSHALELATVAYGAVSAPVAARMSSDLYVNSTAALPGGRVAVLSEAGDSSLTLDVATPAGAVTRHTIGKTDLTGEPGNPTLARTGDGRVVAAYSLERRHRPTRGYLRVVDASGRVGRPVRLPRAGVVWGAGAQPGSRDLYVLRGRASGLFVDRLRGRRLESEVEIAGEFDGDAKLAVDSRGHVYLTWLHQTVTGGDCVLRERVLTGSRLTPTRRIGRCTAD